jgi:hypothetical protein
MTMAQTASKKKKPKAIDKYNKQSLLMQRLVWLYITYYYFIVAASLLLNVLERRKVSGRPATVLHYYTVLIKGLYSAI